jgi:hypothetical protein
MLIRTFAAASARMATALPGSNGVIRGGAERQSLRRRTSRFPKLKGELN